MNGGAWRGRVGRGRQRPGLPGSKIHGKHFKNNSGYDDNHWSGTVNFVLYFIRTTLGIPGGASGKDAGHLRNMGSIPGLGKCPGEGHANPLQRSCLENPMDRGVWRAAVHGVTEAEMTKAT